VEPTCQSHLQPRAPPWLPKRATATHGHRHPRHSAFPPLLGVGNMQRPAGSSSPGGAAVPEAGGGRRGFIITFLHILARRVLAEDLREPSLQRLLLCRLRRLGAVVGGHGLPLHGRCRVPAAVTTPWLRVDLGGEGSRSAGGARTGSGRSAGAGKAGGDQRGSRGTGAWGECVLQRDRG
jgi:hypothetical protein